MPNLKKRLRKHKKQTNFFLIFLLLTIFFSANSYAEDFWLISEEEYSSLKVDESFNQQLSYSANNGPRITLVSPNIVDKVSAPVNIFLKFDSSPTGIEPNMGSLIVHMKGFITLDITKRVEKYINGKELNIEDAKIPKGKHNILIMIMDLQENYSERLISFIVK